MSAQCPHERVGALDASAAACARSPTANPRSRVESRDQIGRWRIGQSRGAVTILKFRLITSNFQGKIRRDDRSRATAGDTEAPPLPQSRGCDPGGAPGREDHARSGLRGAVEPARHDLRSRAPAGSRALGGPRARAGRPPRTHHPGRDPTPTRAVSRLAHAGGSPALPRALSRVGERVTEAAAPELGESRGTNRLSHALSAIAGRGGPGRSGTAVAPGRLSSVLHGTIEPRRLRPPNAHATAACASLGQPVILGTEASPTAGTVGAVTLEAGVRPRSVSPGSE